MRQRAKFHSRKGREGNPKIKGKKWNVKIQDFSSYFVAEECSATGRKQFLFPGLLEEHREEDHQKNTGNVKEKNAMMSANKNEFFIKFGECFQVGRSLTQFCAKLVLPNERRVNTKNRSSNPDSVC